MADVFVSYSRDDKARAEQFVHLLEDQGWDVFWDQETRAGTLWPKVLEDELTRARCLVVLWTGHSVASRWVRIEAYEALQNDKLLPVRLERVKPPMEFRQTQAFDLIGWSGAHDDPRLQQFIADLCDFAKIKPRRRRVPEPARDTGPGTTPATDQEAPTAPPGTIETVAEPTPARSKLWWGLGIATTAIAAVWIGRGLLVSDPTAGPDPPAEPKVVMPGPVKDPDPGIPPGENQAPTKGPVVATKPPAPVPKPAAKAERVLPVRCIEITQKGQMGPLTEEERRFLSSKECAG